MPLPRESAVQGLTLATSHRSIHVSNELALRYAGLANLDRCRLRRRSARREIHTGSATSVRWNVSENRGWIYSFRENEIVEADPRLAVA
jgi:hypothetical protein